MASDWPLTPDGQYYQAEGKLLLPVDPSGVAIVQIRPDGVAIGSGVTAIEKGDPGEPANLDETVNLTELAHDDPTPASASFTTLTPPTESTPGLYRLNIALHRGEPGEDGESVWDPTDLSENPVAGQIPAVNATADGFDLISPPRMEVFYPAAINNTASGNANSTLAVVPVPSRPYPRIVRADGYTVVTGEGPDVRVDLLARLNGESGGGIISRCTGIAQTERLTLSRGPGAGAADTIHYIAAGASATVYFRTERQSGSVTYTTAAATSMFSVEVHPA